MNAGIVGIKITGDASGLESALSGAGRQVEEFGGKVKDSQAASASLANGLKSAFVGSSIAVGLITLKNTIGDVTRALVDAQIQVDKLRNGLNFAVGRSGAAAELEFIRASARTLGLEIASTAEQYTKLAAAARGTSLEGQKTREIFTSIAQASTVMGLSAEQTEGALLAVTQMISKGKVQAEELRGQLGERLPGAFQIAARAMGVTTAELDKMLETGQVLSTDFLPKFAAQLSNEVAPEVANAAQSMQASINRLSSAWTEFKQSVADGGASKSAASGATKLASIFDGFSERMRDAKLQGLGFIDVLTEMALGSAGTLSKKLGDVNLSLVEMKATLAQRPDDIYLKAAIAEADAYRLSLADAIEKQRELRNGAYVSGEDRRFAESARAEAARKEQANARQAAYRATMVTYATDAEKLAKEIEKQKAALGDLYSPEIEARIRKHFIKPVKDASDDYGRLSSIIGKELETAQEQLSSYRNLTESEKFRIKTLAQIDESLRKGNLTKKQAIELEAQMTQAQTVRGEVEKRNALEKAQAETLKDNQRYYDNIAKENNALDEANRKQAQQNEEIGKTVEQLSVLRDARLEAAIAQEEETLAMAAAHEASLGEIMLMKQRINLLKQRRALTAQGDVLAFEEAQRKETVKAADEAAKAWQKTADKIEESITDALMRGFESGKGFAENLRDTVVNMFKTLVLRPVISAIVSPTAALLAGAGSSAAAAQGRPGVFDAGQGGVLSSVSTIKNAYESLSGGFASSISSISATMGKWLIENTTGILQKAGVQLYAKAGSIGTAGAYVGGALAGYGIGSAISGNKSAFGDGNGDVATLAGTAIGAIFGGPIGAAIGGSIGGLVNRAFGQGPKESTGSGITGTFRGSSFSGMSFNDWRRDGGWFTSASTGTDYKALGSSVSQSLGTVYGQITQQTAALAAALGAPTDQILGYVKTIRLDTGSDSAAAITALFENIADELASTFVSSAFIKEGERASVALTRMVSSLATVNTAFAKLDKTLVSASLTGGSSASKLIDLLGGVDQFNAATLSYYQTYYSETERNAKTTAELADSFAALGVAMPDTMAAYRELVNAQDITTESGRTMYAALLGLSGAFATVTTAASEAAKALIKTLNYATYADYAVAMSAAGGTPAPRFAAGGYHMGGVRIVGENGPEAELTGPSRILNNSQLSSMLQGGGDTAGQLEALREEQRAQALSVAALTTRMVKIFETWDATGMPELRPAP